MEFLTKRRSTQSSDDANQLDQQQQPRTVATKQYQMDETTKRYPMDEKWWIPTKLPKIDSENVIGSLAGMLGPTPEEREQQEQQLMEHKRKMHGWTALFNGLRHLSNLYFTTKGASPQQYADPHAQIEQQYQEERKRLADIQANNQKYYAGLWGLYRQVNDEQRRNMLAEAQRDYYGTREDVAREKQELERLKAVRVIKQTDGSLVKFDPVTGETEQLTETDPLYIEYMKSRINRNNRTGTGRSGGGSSQTYGYRTTKWKEDGKVITERVPTTGGQPQGKESPTRTVQQPKGGNNSGQKKKKHVGW